MGRREWCPGCNSSTSSLNEAWDNFEPCPVCGLGPEAWHEVQQIRISRDDDALAMKCSALIIANDKLKQELGETKHKLNKLRGVLREVDDEE